MKNKKTFKILLIGIALYMLLSWIIVAGNFSDGNYASVGFNQFGIFDFLLAPLNLFNYFVVTVTKNINGYVNQIGYGNVIIAFISIAIFYGILNKTGAYTNLINNIKNKVKKKNDIFMLSVAFIYCLFSSLTGLNLVLFMYFPAISAIMGKLKYNKFTIFLSTIGAMMIGQLGSLFNPNINGLNRVLFQSSLTENLVSKIILFLMLTIVLIGTLYLNNDKTVKKEEVALLFDDETKLLKEKKKNYYPIIIIVCFITIIMSICMYNWYYMFNNTAVTKAYDNITSYGIHGYNFMKNIFGISEPFGYWSGFTMSALLILASLVLSFIYKLNLEKIFEGARKGIIDIIPTIFYSIISLTIIILSLYNSDSFIYSIINNIFNTMGSSQIVSILLSSMLHNFFINDYFALLSSLSSPLTSIFGYEKISLTLMTTQVAHGLVSLITPFNVYLIAGLTYLNISYIEWIKNIWKFLVIITILSVIVLFITASFI